MAAMHMASCVMLSTRSVHMTSRVYSNIMQTKDLTVTTPTLITESPAITQTEGNVLSHVKTGRICSGEHMSHDEAAPG